MQITSATVRFFASILSSFPFPPRALTRRVFLPGSFFALFSEHRIATDLKSVLLASNGRVSGLIIDGNGNGDLDDGKYVLKLYIYHLHLSFPLDLLRPFREIPLLLSVRRDACHAHYCSPSPAPNKLSIDFHAFVPKIPLLHIIEGHRHWVARLPLSAIWFAVRLSCPCGPWHALHTEAQGTICTNWFNFVAELWMVESFRCSDSGFCVAFLSLLSLLFLPFLLFCWCAHDVCCCLLVLLVSLVSLVISVTDCLHSFSFSAINKPFFSVASWSHTVRPLLPSILFSRTPIFLLFVSGWKVAPPPLFKSSFFSSSLHLPSLHCL